MFRRDRVAAANFRAAQAFYRRKLRTLATTRAAADIRSAAEASEDEP